LAAKPGLGAFAHHALPRIQFSNSSRLLTRLRDLAAVLRANAIKMSLPGLTRQSICFEKALAK